MSLSADVTSASLATTAPVTLPPPLTVKGPAFEPGSGSGVRPVVFDAPEKRTLPFTVPLLTVNWRGEPMPMSPVMVPLLKLVWLLLNWPSTANCEAPPRVKVARAWLDRPTTSASAVAAVSVRRTKAEQRPVDTRMPLSAVSQGQCRVKSGILTGVAIGLATFPKRFLHDGSESH